jgi:hypothetical protein
MNAAQSSGVLERELGPPLNAGPWYNATIAQKARGRVVHCTIPVSGQRASSDLTVGLIRTDSSSITNVLAYPAGIANWHLLSCTAALPANSNGTLPRSYDLLAKDPYQALPKETKEAASSSNRIQNV